MAPSVWSSLSLIGQQVERGVKQVQSLYQYLRRETEIYGAIAPNAPQTCVRIIGNGCQQHVAIVSPKACPLTIRERDSFQYSFARIDGSSQYG